jgi:hypothetical protein
MQEKLLQFIWQYNLYRPDGLATTDGQQVRILHAGTLNTNAGPDFSTAKIRIGDTLLIGHVELHVRTSDWNRHGHQHDAAYCRLILHVVYEHDLECCPGEVPVLVLKGAIPAYVYDKYTSLLQTTHPLPCAHHLGGVGGLVRESWLSRLLVERWEEKLQLWQEDLARAGGDWRTLLYWRMAANFGFKVNAAPFLLLAQSLPLQLLGKQHRLLQIEALLFGQAGMLERSFKDEYPQQLQAEYHFLKGKYGLEPIAAHLWKFMRLRPANFPTVRIAQFADLVHRSLHLFTRIGDTGSIGELKNLLAVGAGAYWDSHYRFEEPQRVAVAKHLGSDSADNIIINTIAPIRFLYAWTQGQAREQEGALQLLEEVPAENNNVARLWERHGWNAGSAAQSQPLLQLYNQYCSRKRCLECAIGLHIIKSGPDK